MPNGSSANSLSMNELFQFLFVSIYVIEFIPVAIGFYYYNQIKNTYWKWFLYYLIFIFIAELVSNYEVLIEPGDKKYLYGFIIIPIEFLFFYWLYAYKSFNNKKLFWIFLLVYVVSFVPHLYLESHKSMVYSFNYVVGAFLLGILVVMEYLKQIRSDSILQFKENKMFYINLGVSLLYIGTLPFFSFYAIIAKNDTIYTNYHLLFLIVNHLMYLLFSMSFIWGKPNTY
jgi:hypothetical protein